MTSLSLSNSVSARAFPSFLSKPIGLIWSQGNISSCLQFCNVNGSRKKLSTIHVHQISHLPSTVTSTRSTVLSLHKIRANIAYLVVSNSWQRCLLLVNTETCKKVTGKRYCQHEHIGPTVFIIPHRTSMISHTSWKRIFYIIRSQITHATFR